MKADNELKQIAVDIFDSKIFCDRHIPKEEFERIRQVFMPIILGAFKDMSVEEFMDIGLIYEYYSKALPRGINGMPMFTSLQILSQEETKKMFTYYNEYKELKEKFQNETKNQN